jgi:hypothetical protein
LRIAFAFKRADVDQFKEETDADQWNEWRLFFAQEPQGWQATALIIQRLSWSIFQSQTQDNLKEADFAMKFGAKNDSLKMQRIRLEAGTIKANIAHERKRKKEKHRPTSN